MAQIIVKHGNDVVNTLTVDQMDVEDILRIIRDYGDGHTAEILQPVTPSVRVENIYDAATKSYAVSLIRTDQHGEWTPASYCLARKSEARAKERELRQAYCEA